MPERIGRFEVVEKIGEGGMGEVFKARDPHINRIVAIKLLREAFNTQEMRDRFMLEARSAGSLQNPYIVTIFEVGEHNGAPFIVMEFVVGDPLDQLVRRRAPLSLHRKLDLMEALCAGLGAAHRAGIIHRDVKPPNLMVIPDSMLKILDFGIARVGKSEMTKMGTLIGTPNYMSPEQMNGGTIDNRTDIFAAGAVCYELLSYERAFPGNHTEAITRILTRDPLSLLKLCPSLEPEIAGVVGKALKKHPGDRYQDLADMRRDIVRIKDRLKREAPETLFQPITAETMIGADDRPGPTPASSRMREELRRRSMAEVDAARRLFDQGDIAEALQRLEQFTPANEFVNEALAALQERAEEIQREALRVSTRARALLAAQEAFERGDFEAAVRAADEALLVDERSAGARDIRRQARHALGEQRLHASLMRRVTWTIDEARRMFAARNHQGALDLLAAFEPAHPEIAAVLDELQAEDAAIETALAAEQAKQWERSEAERRGRQRAERIEAEPTAKSVAAAPRLAQADTAQFNRDLILRQADEHYDHADRYQSIPATHPPNALTPPPAWQDTPTHSVARRIAIPAGVTVVVVAAVVGGFLLRPAWNASPASTPAESAPAPRPTPAVAPPPASVVPPATTTIAPAPPIPPEPRPLPSAAGAGINDRQPSRRDDTIPPPNVEPPPPSETYDMEGRQQRLEAVRNLRRAQEYIDAGDVESAAAEIAKAQQRDPANPGLPKITAAIEKLKRLEQERRRRQGSD
jgi:eukaryotic-like serine/threonine-protein kinase